MRRLGLWRFAPARADTRQARPKSAAPAVPDHARLSCSCFSLGKLCLCADAAGVRLKRQTAPTSKSTTHALRVVKPNQNPPQSQQSLHTCKPRPRNSAATALCTARASDSARTASPAEGSGHSPGYLACTAHPVRSARSARTGQLAGRRLRSAFRSWVKGKSIPSSTKAAFNALSAACCECQQT